MNLSRPLVLALALAAGSSHAQDVSEPDYAFAFTVGHIKPETADWSTYYPDRTPREVALAFGWKPLRMIELGVETSYFSARGAGNLATNNRTGGHVLHEVAPVGVYALVRGQTHFDQLLVPYVGASIDRVYYQQNIAEADRSRGHTIGHGIKGGIQISLDRIEPLSTRTLRRDYGIEHVFFIAEYGDYTAKMKDRGGVDTELLGRSTRFGLLLEF